MINSNWCRLLQKIEEQSGQKNRKKLWPTVDIARRENLKYLNKRKNRRIRSDEKSRKHGQRRETLANPGRLPKGASCVEADGTEATDQGLGQRSYATRKFIVEPVFRTDSKQARGFRQFLLRGLEKVRGEWALICMTHNILKFHTRSFAVDSADDFPGQGSGKRFPGSDLEDKVTDGNKFQLAIGFPPSLTNQKRPTSTSLNANFSGRAPSEIPIVQFRTRYEM